MAHLEFGQDRLAQPHPLQALELAQRPVERPLEVQSTTPSAPAVELTIYITNMISNSYIGQISHDDYPTRESHNRRSTHNPYASCNIHAATPQVRTPRLGMLSALVRNYGDVLEGRQAAGANRLFSIFARRVARSLRVKVH